MNIQLPPMKPQDKVVAAILGLIAAVPLVYGATIVVPILLELAKNTLYLLVITGIIFFALIALWDSRRDILYAWKNLSRNIRKAIVREDPIGTLETVIQRFRSKLETIDEAITSANAARKRHADGMKKMRERAEKEGALVEEAQRQGRPDLEVKQHAAAHQRWSEAAEEMIPQQALYTDMCDSYQQAKELTESKIADLADQKELLAMRLDALLEGQKTVKLFKRFFGTNPDMVYQELAIEQAQIKATEAEAEIDQFMRATKPALERAELERDAQATLAMKKFSKYATHELPPASDTEPLRLAASNEKVAVKR